jgi:hypothetical protein
MKYEVEQPKKAPHTVAMHVVAAVMLAIVFVLVGFIAGTASTGISSYNDGFLKGRAAGQLEFLTYLFDGTFSR